MNWKLSRRDVVVGGAVIAACGRSELFDEPLAQWPEEEDVPSAIPQPAKIAKPGESSLYDPLVLYAETVIPTGSSSSPNTAALANPHSLPMELLGIRFRIYTLNTSGASVAGGEGGESVSGLGIGVKLDMGNIPIVDANTPVSLFSTVRDDSEDGPAGYYNFTTSAVVTDSSPVAHTYEYHWRFAKPMFIPPGAVVAPLFSHLTQTPWDVKVGVTYYCRTFRKSARTPQFVHVPWVSRFLSKSFDITGSDPVTVHAADSDESTELDIRNPFPAGRVELARLTGRVNYYISGNNGTNPNSNYERSSINYGDQIYDYLRVVIRGSRGDEIVRTPTLFGLLFPQVIKSWELGPGWFMYPNEFYKVFLTRSAFSGPNTAAATARMQVGIGAVGYRKINTSTLEGAL